MDGFNDLMKRMANFFVDYGFNIVATIAVLIIGGLLIKLLTKLFMKIVYASKLDNASWGFFVALLKVGLWIVLIFACASILGVDGNSFLVAFSSIALAIGLALKDSLSNIANGLVIVMVKPFKKGDRVAIGSTEGIIKKISILTTELVTFDNKKIVFPNNMITSSSITNFSSNLTRRVEFKYSVSYSSDMKQVKKILLDAVNGYEYTLKNPVPFIFMESHSASSVDFNVRFWVNTDDYWNAFYGLNEKIFEVFKANNIEIPFNQLDVHIKRSEENEK